MFDVTADEIASLNDSDLRELVGRLCEAELSVLGLSPVAVTWGGSQTAADGGLDVRVAATASVTGFIPHQRTGFQVKTSDMARADILYEMKPNGEVRPVIKELADAGGAYVIVSSHGSTADIALQRRRDAMREALADVENADQLHTDFYDRTRLATWARRHPGPTIWVKERIGRAISGWRPYGAWSNPTEGVDAEYLVDERLTLHIGNQGDAPELPMLGVIDKLRDDLAVPGKMVRLVGLSGVGKTRLVQALFDSRVGSRPLAPSLAVYANLSDNPTPQPVGLASDLIASRTRAILIIDNCPPDLHRRLAELCRGPGTTLSVITVEYDVRDDQPEGTEVVRLDTSSPELICRLLKHRFPTLSDVDASTISEASGGNSRIAIALAATVESSGSIGGLSDDELFQRLFRQRHDPSDALLRAAQACSLVYSFEGESLTGDNAELPRLAALAGQSPLDVYGHVGELLRRDLAQRRSVWRAVLPHAIANRLAASALESVPYAFIDQHLVTGGTERVARSFSRRLSFLHASPSAVEIVERWLSPDGLLGDLTTLNELGQAMFDNVAPVSPERALVALERVANRGAETAAPVLVRYRLLLRSIAYDPALFERCVALLVAAGTTADEREAQNVSDALKSLFQLYLSGTHATIQQRLAVIERLLLAQDPERRALGLATLDQSLKVWQFTSSYSFEFGARPRNFGYDPENESAVRNWYAATLCLLERIWLIENDLRDDLRELLAGNFRDLWTNVQLFDELDSLLVRFAGGKFWREGWLACHQVMRFDKDQLSPDVLSRLMALEVEMRPSNLADRVRAIATGDRPGQFDLLDTTDDEDTGAAFERLSVEARDLGVTIANDMTTFRALVPDLVRGGTRAAEFGCGLGDASRDCLATWNLLADGIEAAPSGTASAQVLWGYLSSLSVREPNLAHQLLEEAFQRPGLVRFIPALYSAIQIDERGIKRLKRALEDKSIPIGAYRSLAYGRATDGVSGPDLRDLLLLILEQAEGGSVALEILSMRFHSDRQAQRELASELIEAGQEILKQDPLGGRTARDEYKFSAMIITCLGQHNGAPIAAEIARRLSTSWVSSMAHASESRQLKALLTVQPLVVLDALFASDTNGRGSGARAFSPVAGAMGNPADVIPVEVLLDWCEQDRRSRYQVAASFVTFASRAEENGPLVWSEHAKALLARGPDPVSILATFTKRFRPMSCSGSRASLMEANAALLDRFETSVPGPLLSFAAEEKTRLGREIIEERARENRWSRERDERFE